MKKKLFITIEKQPDNTSCGPTSLHSVYDYYDDQIDLQSIVEDIEQFDAGGGTLAVVLGKHALKRGYEASIYSYNINIFDPTWFDLPKEKVCANLIARAKSRHYDQKQVYAIHQYIDFLELGGTILFDDLSKNLLVEILDDETPILAGLSSTWLYQASREDNLTTEDDAINGDPAGHFVVISGFNQDDQFYVADPYLKNPVASSHHYKINSDRLINAILLGISSYDGNLLVIKKK